MTRRVRGAALALLVAAACTSESNPAVVIDSLSSPAAPGSGEPNLALDSAGRAVLSWIEPAADSSHALRMAVLDGTAWSVPRTIAQHPDLLVNWADFPSVAAMPGGGLAAHWMQRTPGTGFTYDMFIAQSVDGGATWSAPIVPHRDGTLAEHGFAALYPVESGGVGAAWLDGRKYADTTRAAVREMMLVHTAVAANGALGGEEVLDFRICDCCQTSLAFTASGPAVVYRDRSPGEIRDIAIVRLVDGSWSAPAVVHADGWEIRHCPVNGPAIAARDSAAAVAWFTNARDTARVMVAFSADAGATFGSPVRVDQGNPAGRVDVEMDNEGSALVSWIERTGGDTAQVRLRRIFPEGEMDDPITIATSSAARASGFPRMVTRSGDVILAWTVPGTPSSVRVARVRLPPPR
jgi:hypothetical protein